MPAKENLSGRVPRRTKVDRWAVMPIRRLVASGKVEAKGSIPKSAWTLAAENCQNGVPTTQEIGPQLLGLQHLDEFAEQRRIVVPGAGGDEVAIDDDLLVDIRGAPLFGVERAFGYGGDIATLNHVGGR